MGYLISQRRTARIIPRKPSPCKAKNIAEVLTASSWEGKRCFIICGGPSLEGFDFSRIQNELTIGINKAFLAHPSTINYSMDQRFYDQITYSNRADQESTDVHNAWLGFRGLKVFPKISEKAKFDPNVYYVKTLKNTCISLDVSQGIYAGNNSGFGGLMLAISLGCKNIVLLGLDLKVDEKRKRSHWHSGYRHQKLDKLPRILEKFRKEFECFAESIRKLGINVINANKDSTLKCFPKKDIREVL